MREDQRKEIEELVAILKDHCLTELEIEKKGMRIRVRREAQGPASSPLPTSASTVLDHLPSPEPAPRTIPVDHSQYTTVISPIVGTFYRSPSPDADAYVEEGDYIKKGQVVCIVEAMKLMNEIESETDGRLVKILVESTTPVEYGQPLFLIDPNSDP